MENWRTACVQEVSIWEVPPLHRCDRDHGLKKVGHVSCVGSVASHLGKTLFSTKKALRHSYSQGHLMASHDGTHVGVCKAHNRQPRSNYYARASGLVAPDS